MRSFLASVLGVLVLAAGPGCKPEPEVAAGERYGEDPDALGAEPEAFASFAGPQRVLNLRAYEGQVRQLTTDDPEGRFVEGARVQAYRRFSQNEVDMLLVADVDTLQTAVLPSDWMSVHSTPAVPATSRRERLDATFRSTNTPVSQVSRSSAPGHTRVALTVDMCQSQRPWERGFFEWAINEGVRRRGPLAINIAMTGIWARKHAAEFAQLQTWRSSGALRVTWVNHSFRHPLHCVGAVCSFLTSPNENVASEVLSEEVDLLARGETPSLFFRFPGLVHNARTVAQVSALGLYTTDADAWIAKGQPLHDGAIILLHGNGNEPAGITRFMRAMEGPWSAALRDKTLEFVALSDF